MSHNIIISRNTYGGVFWSIRGTITYDDIVYLVEETKNDRYFAIVSKKDRECIRDLPIYRREIEKFLPQIQDPLVETVEILTESPRERFVIYHLCKILRLRYERIIEHGRKYTGCNEYLPRNEWEHRFGRGLVPPNYCGCNYAPDNFWKYHVKNNYEDSVSYSNLPWTYKQGVRIFKKLI